MTEYSPLIDRLIAEIGRLPGIGRKTAQRIAFHFIEAPPERVQPLLEAILAVKRDLRLCAECGAYTDTERCPVCADTGRDRALLCLVEGARDIHFIERTGSYRGRYHVLGGVISPLDGVNPGDLAFTRLVERVHADRVTEVIVALNQTAESEVTALYTARLLSPLGVRVTRLAQGLPMGAHLEYADQHSLGRSLEERHEVA